MTKNDRQPKTLHCFVLPRFREMLKKSDDHSKKIMLDRLSGHPMGKFLFTGKRNVGQICLPGTGCEYLDMGREAEAKEFLNPSSSTNPGKRRRRRSLKTS
uniref:Uncharacterized protein n=1 Tax=Tetranychus urticae TaxID=32264 RepID=A0A158P4X6_TETUR